MKKAILISLLLAGLVIVPATAQNFQSERPQFLSFSIGAAAGFNLGSEDVVGGGCFSLNFPITDQIEVGLERLTSTNLIRISYQFNEMLGASIGFGTNSSAVLGIYTDLYKARAANGIAYSLGVRLDYLADTSAFADGSFLISIRSSFGL